MRLFEINQPSAAEVWRTVPDWPKYEVSNTGLVRNAANDRLLSQWDHTGRGTTYKRVTLRDMGRRLNARVHRLVAMAFLPQPEGTTQVDHLDNNSFNNNVKNLEWVTGGENLARMQSNRADKRDRRNEPTLG